MENSRCSYPKKTHHFARFSIHPQCFSQPLQVAWPGRCIHNLYRPDSAIVPALHGPWVSRMANSTTICRIGDVIYDICIFVYIYIYMCVCVIYAVSWDLVASPIWHLGGKPRRSRVLTWGSAVLRRSLRIAGFLPMELQLRLQMGINMYV